MDRRVYGKGRRKREARQRPGPRVWLAFSLLLFESEIPILKDLYLPQSTRAFLLIFEKLIGTNCQVGRGSSLPSLRRRWIMVFATSAKKKNRRAGKGNRRNEKDRAREYKGAARQEVRGSISRNKLSPTRFNFRLLSFSSFWRLNHLAARYRRCSMYV